MKDNSYQSFLEELKRKVDFVTLVSHYTSLTQRGRNYWGCCPFHHEKTPSFTIDPYEGFYHCFGCKEGGDIIRFVQKMENCSFPDAVALLAKSCNMEVPTFRQDESVVKRKKDKEKILKILDLASKHYHENLYQPDAKKAQDYIKMRGFTRHELNDFYLGYSKNFSEIISYMKKQGFTEEDMLMAGLIQKNPEKNSYYDTQGGRLVFPIYNTYEECIGFTSRVLEKTDYAKYKNTPDTLVFDKSRTVFAINLVKRRKIELGINYIVIVEGQIDVIAMHRAGFKNTVACLGTALTPYHAKELKRFVDRIVLCFDGDGAGVKATLRAINILQDAGLEIKIVSLPDGKDPDEILKERGKEFLQKEIEGAKPVMDFYINYEKSRFDISKADEKGKFIKECLEHLKKVLPMSSMQEPYLAKIRDITGVPVEVLRRDLGVVTTSVAMTSDDKKDEAEKVEASPVRDSLTEKATKFILASLLHKKNYVRQNFNYQKLIDGKEYIFEFIKNKTPISSIYDIYDVENDAFLKDLIYFDFSAFEGNEQKYFEECLILKYEEKLKAEKFKIAEQLKVCENLDDKKKLLVAFANADKKLREKNLEEFNEQ